MRYFLLIALLFVLQAPISLLAQTEIEMGQVSLKGITSFRVVVEVERSGPILDDPMLAPGHLHASVVSLLRDVGLPVQPESNPGEMPFLLIHVNAMDADRGQIPFMVDAGFFQEVHLNRPPNLTIQAQTWESAVLGMTYHNQLELIPEAVMDLVSDFIGDYQAVNS